MTLIGISGQVGVLMKLCTDEEEKLAITVSIEVTTILCRNFGYYNRGMTFLENFCVYADYNNIIDSSSRLVILHRYLI